MNLNLHILPLKTTVAALFVDVVYKHKFSSWMGFPFFLQQPSPS